MSFFGELCAFVDVNFGGGDSAAVDLFYLQAGVEIQGGGGFVENGGIDARVYEGSEEHVTTDAGEAVEVGDAHGGYCFMVGWRSLPAAMDFAGREIERSKIPAVPLPLFFRRD